MHSITSEQLDALIQIINDEFGLKLARTQFDDQMLLLFEDVAGFEVLSSEQALAYLEVLWHSIGARSGDSSRKPSWQLDLISLAPELFRLSDVPFKQLATHFSRN